MFATNSYFATFATPLRRVSRINIDDRNASMISFIFDKLLKLTEGPGVNHGSLLSSCFNPVSDIGQFFKSDHVAGLTVCDDGFTDAVVDVLHVAAFFAREQFQSVFRRLRAFALKSLAKLRIMPSDVHNLFARKLLSIRSGGDIVKS
jgi:hypothetical protein